MTKPRGRPPIPPGERKGTNVNFRVRKDLREWIGAEAKKSGRSISEEIEYTLEARRSGMEVVIQALGGPQAAGIVKPILVYLGQLNASGIDWKTDKELASLVKIGLCHVTDAAIREQPIPYEEWMTELVNIQLKYDNKEKVLDTVGKAFIVLEILGLAEGAPEDSLWNRLKALGDASPKEGSDPS